MKAARVYATELSWRVLPVKRGGKRPILRDWTNTASNDLETIDSWIEQYPDANIGILTGETFFVLDVDPKKGGNESLAALIAKHGPLPKTAQARTGSGGSHYLFSLPDFPVHNSVDLVGPGLDIRGIGGQIVVAPSRTDAGPYSWVNKPWDCKHVPASEWLLEVLRRAPTRDGKPVTQEDRGYFPAASPAVLEAAREALERFGPALQGKGGDNHTFVAAAILIHDFALTDEEALPLFAEWNETCRPPWSEPDLRAKLRGGGAYGKEEYGNRRAMDSLEIARKWLTDWQTGAHTEKGMTAMLDRIRTLPFESEDELTILANELHSATGFNIRALRLPRARAAQSDAPKGSIEVTTRLHEVADEATRALLGLKPGVFQRNGVLCEVVPTNRSLAVHEMESAGIQDLMSRAAKFVRQDEKRGLVTQAAPANVATILAARRVHKKVRVLEAITTAPVFLADGTILQKRGYNEQARVYLDPAEGLQIEIPDEPTRADARAAVELFEDLLCDVPFISPADFSSWLAALLTPLTKSATDNAPAPLFCVSAAAAGAGKTLLTKTLAQVITGGDAEIRSYNTRDTGEWLKKLTSFVKVASPVSVFDNVNGHIGDEALDRLITSSTWSDRILGVSDAPPLPNVTTWMATGNNIEPIRDTVRRVCLIRFDVLDDKPQERKGFKYDLDGGYALDHRSELLSAALTILRAFHVAGRPSQGLPSWGSFTAWSTLVRGALVWAGAADPFETQRRASSELNDSENESHDFWLTVIEKADGTVPSIVVEANRQDAMNVLNLRDPPSNYNLKKLIGRFVDKPRSGRRIRKTRSETATSYTIETLRR